MEAAAVRSIPLDRLVLSQSNVRKTPPSAAEEAELKASLRAHGLKQNLVVCPAPEVNGAFAVTAGGRRLKALQELAAEGVIAADYQVPCIIEDPGAVLETSLLENRVRLGLHPGDEFLAISALIEAGQPVEAIARRFGVSEKHVRQRLRLGKVAPELLDEFRAGALSLEVLTAFTLGADHESQRAVWRQVKGQPHVSSYTVRRLLTQGAVPLDSPLGAFIGAAAYEAAGGTITRDLFSGDEEGFLDDAALVRRLAIEKLEAKAEEMRPHWAWTRAALDPDYGFLAQYGRIRPRPAAVPPEITQEIARIEERLAALETLPEDAWSAGLISEAAELEERRDELAEVVEGLAVYTEEDRARAGIIVTVGEDGDFCLHQGLVERRARRDEDAADPAESGDEGDDRESDGFDDPTRTLTTAMVDRRGLAPRSTEQAVRKECGLGQTLVDDLKAHRLQITRAHLAGDFGVAFDLALYALCTELFRQIGYFANPLELRANETPLRSSLSDLAGTPADRLLEAQRKTLALDWLEMPDAQAFAGLTALSAEDKQRLFAWCIALSLKPQLAIEDRADPVIEAAGRRLAIPFADCWRPTAANYWGRVKKAHGLAIGREILGERWARDHADDKKPALAAALETAFDLEASAASIGVGPVERERAAGWLPPGIAYAGVTAADEAGESALRDAGESPDPGEATFIDVEEDGGDGAEIDDATDELPAFLVGDEIGGDALDEASAP